MFHLILSALWFGAFMPGYAEPHVLDARAVPDNRVAELNYAIPLPADIKASGEHGTVVIEGALNADGAILDPKIASSSRSDRIDALALSLAGRVKEAGKQVLDQGYTRVRVFVMAYNYDPTSLRGIREYHCDQAVLDSDWYRRTYATDNVGSLPLATMFMTAGLGTRPELKFGAYPTRFQQAWWEAVEECRADQGRSFVDVLIKRGNSK